MATSFESIKLNFQSSAYSTAVTQLESKMKELEQARTEYDQRRSEILSSGMAMHETKPMRLSVQTSQTSRLLTRLWKKT